ncbi:MAG: hypothetical protein ACRBN8_46150 [Nannocystales bacterium]
MSTSNLMTRRFFTTAIAGAFVLLAGASTAAAAPEKTTIEHNDGKTTVETDRDGTSVRDHDHDGRDRGGEATRETNHKEEVERTRDELDRQGKDPK